MRYFSNEIVFRGHPDRVCDQIGAAILAECVKQDKKTRAGIEVTEMIDVTPLPHNGCRPPKRRRV